MKQSLIKLLLLCATLSNYCFSANEQQMAFLTSAKTMIAQGNLDEAFLILCKAMEHRNSTATFDLELGNNLLSLGNQYFKNGMNEQALAAYRKILHISDNFAAAHHSIGYTLAAGYGKHHEALASYTKALSLQPDIATIHYYAAHSFLAIGDLLRGFEEFKYRWQRNKDGYPQIYERELKNSWDGKVSLQNKTFVICGEQGLGDTLQFIRYAQLLKEQGAYVIAEVQKPLVPIISRCPYIDQVIAKNSSIPPYNYYAAMFSLPRLFKTTLETIPNTIPYLYADEHLVEQWRGKLSSDAKFKIGICWHGDKSHAESKFMPLQEFIPLLQRTDVSVYNLQQYNGLDQLKLLPHDAHLHCFDETFDREPNNFMDTAAMMKNLDLVITADTSIAHLAGGLGVPVWVILPFPSEWRWLLNRADSPWYPTMVLFRKKAESNWQTVMQTIMKTLDVMVQLKQTAITN